MPVSRTTNKKKEDATQKLKEIKQRQQNWLKQREQSKVGGESRPKIASAPSSSTKANTVSRLPMTNKTTNNTERQVPHIQTRFKNWMSTRENGSKEDICYEDNLSIRSGAESELARLVTPEAVEVIQGHPVAEEQFDDLADKIANKVRSDLGLSHSLAGTARTESTEITQIGSEHISWRSEKCKTFTQDASSVNNFNSSNLMSHNCPICKKVMMSSRNLPMMVIPCGHTLCKSCSDGRHKCPACDCVIVSLTVNIMLQQIIQEFHSHHPTHNTPPSLDNRRVMSESRPGYVEDNRRNRMASYTSQLTNLQTRHDILTAEQTELLDKQKHVTSQLRHNHKQVASVKNQEQEVEKAILDLHERLSALQKHREQYESQTVELADEKTKLDGKVSMLAATISSLSREIENVDTDWLHCWQKMKTEKNEKLKFKHCKFLLMTKLWCRMHIIVDYDIVGGKVTTAKKDVQYYTTCRLKYVRFASLAKTKYQNGHKH